MMLFCSNVHQATGKRLTSLLSLQECPVCGLNGGLVWTVQSFGGGVHVIGIDLSPVICILNMYLLSIVHTEGTILKAPLDSH